MWFFLVASSYGVSTTVGPFKSEEQCREAQAAVEKSRVEKYVVVLPCWRGQ